MRISQSGVDLIKQFEGLELEAYQDIAGIWTIGYGHTGADVEPDQCICEEEAEELLRTDLTQFEEGVSRSARVGITQNQFDALVSLAYNIGMHAFCNSTALRRLNKQDFLAAAEAMRWWNKATINGVKQEVLGLTRRRIAESAMFLEDVTHANANNIDVVDMPEKQARVVPEENKPRRGNLACSRTMGGAAIAGAGGTLGIGSVMMEVTNDVDAPSSAIAAAPGNACISPQEEHTGGALADERPLTTAGHESEGTVVAGTVQPTSSDALTQADYGQALQIAAGVMVILGVLYVIFARIDDWWRYRR